MNERAGCGTRPANMHNPENAPHCRQVCDAFMTSIDLSDLPERIEGAAAWYGPEMTARRD